MADNQFSSDPTEISDVIELKLAVLGQTLVGKSALTYRFISDKFPTEHDTTIEDQYKINTVGTVGQIEMYNYDKSSLTSDYPYFDISFTDAAITALTNAGYSNYIKSNNNFSSYIRGTFSPLSMRLIVGCGIFVNSAISYCVK